MGTSSARPDDLDHLAASTSAAGARLRRAADDAVVAANRFRASCPETPLAIRAPILASRLVGEALDTASEVRAVADAFRAADTSGAPLAITDDATLAATILARHPGLATGELVEPLRARGAAGRGAGERLLAALRTTDPERLSEVLVSVSQADADDPTFAAGLIGTIDTDELICIVDLLAANTAWQVPSRGMRRLAQLYASATRTWDAPPSLLRLDEGGLSDLLASPRGRNALRALLGTSPTPLGLAFLRIVAPVLLWRHAGADDARSTPLSSFVHNGGRGDAPVLTAVALTPGAGYDLLVAAGGGQDPSDGLARLFSQSGEQSQLAALLRNALADPRLPADVHDDARTSLLAAIVDGVLTGGPGDVGVPLAQLIAETIVTDPTFYEGRADEPAVSDLEEVFTAITPHEGPFVTALFGFTLARERRIAESLDGSYEHRRSAIVNLAAVESAFEAAARRTDPPGDPWALSFDVLGRVVDAVRHLAPGGPVGSFVAGAVVHRGLDAAHGALVPEADDHEDQVMRDRTRTRREAWVAMALDPRFANRLDFGPETSIRNVDDLVRLTTDPTDLDELAEWASRQPAELRDIVDSYADAVR